MNEINPHEAVDFIFKHAQTFAIAKAKRVYLEEFRKSKKAILMQHSQESAVNAQERDAYSHPEYLQLLEALRRAVEIEERLRWELISAQARIDVWRTQQANMRQEHRATV